MKKLLRLLLIMSIGTQQAVYAEEGETVCPVDPNYVIEDYAAYAVEYGESGEMVVEEVAQYVADNLEDVLAIRVAGHSAIFGNSDVWASSEERASVAYEALVESIQEKISEGADPYLEYNGYGGDCPIITNDTQANRSINRRVEIYVVMGDTPPPGPSPSNQDHNSWIDVLSFSMDSTNSKATRCLAKRIKKGDGNHQFLGFDLISKTLDSDNTKKPIKRTVKNLRKLAKNKLLRLKEKVSEVEVPPRFKRFLENKRRSIIRGIDVLDSQANCQDPRVIKMREWIRSKSKEKDSLYSCKAIKQKVSAMMSSIGGQVDGCSAN